MNMKKNIILLPLLVMCFTTVVSAQSGTAILPFKEGKVLSADDIGFLQMINNEAGQPTSRGGTSGQVTIGSNELKEGAALTKADEAAITKAMESYGKEHATMVSKTGEARGGDSRGAYCDYCCYYYYWDYGCGCYLYYWYYCCACY